MDETKKVLRSLLVSSPQVCTVEKLIYDYEDFMGFKIPFKEMGFDSLLSLMHAMSDVLLVNGNSMKSQVTLIVSEKTAHVNDMVLKQKKSNSNRGPVRRPNRTSRYTVPHKMNLNRNLSFASPARNDSITQEPLKDHTKNNYSSVIPEGYNTLKKNISNQSPNITHDSKANVEKVQVSPVNTIQPKLQKLMEIDAKLPVVTKTDVKKTDIHYLRRPNYNLSNSDTIVNTQSGNGMHWKNFTLDKEDDDFMRELLFKKDLYKKSARNIADNADKFVKKDGGEMQNRIPQHVQENLKCLISKFPHGVWCSDLPTEYRKEFKKNLDYEEMGYRSLINMCIDLYNIFICSKESSCDFKLYDVRKPLMQPTVIQDVATPSPQAGDSPKTLLPKLDWKSCGCLIPNDILPLGKRIKREFFEAPINSNEIFQVVAAEIYDISKFWLYKNDGKLDALMDSMQEFYRVVDEKYLIPEELLEIDLYCAVITLNEFHRAVIINVEKDIVKVFFIDYGSLAIIPKNKVWFLKKCFSELPAQAIRARLADIYPPMEHSAWSKKAIQLFRSFASMKKLEAKIRNIIPQKQIAEVYLMNKSTTNSQYLNDFLCSEGLALKTNVIRKVSMDDPHCKPKVKYVHLFPTFEEIEYWLVPSVENMFQLNAMDVSPELFFPQYFSRASDKRVLNKLENKARKIYSYAAKVGGWKKLRSIGNMETMEKILYGDKYSNYEEFVKDADCNDWESEEETDSNVEMWIFLNQLKRKRMNKSDSSQLSCNGGVNTLIKEGNDENDDIAKQFFGSKFVESKNLDKDQMDNFGNWSHLNSHNLQELERYLSEESSLGDSPVPSKLVDFDDSSSSLNDPDNSKKDAKCERNSLYSSSVSSSRNGFESMEAASMLNNTIELDAAINSNESTYSDLIKLDVVLDSQIQNTTEKSDGLWSKKIEVASSDPFGSLDEVDYSFSNINLSNTTDVETQSNISVVESIRTNVNGISNQNAPQAAPGFGMGVPNGNPHEPPMPPKRWTNPGNVNRNPVNAVRPPPGFGPIPNYGAPFEVGSPGRVSTYQPWSTNSMDNFFPINNMALNQQQFYRQLYAMYGYPPPVIVNYNVTSFISPTFGTAPFGDQKRTNDK